MRKRIWIVCIAMLAVCLLLLLFKAKQHQRIVLPEQGEALTNSLSQQELTQAIRNPEVPTASRIAAVPPAAGAPITTGDSNTVDPRVLAEWQVPIEFYGRVVDEKSNPVAGAKISFQWVETPTEDGTRTSTTESDEKGLFSLHGKQGPSLIVWIGKEGYYPSHHGQWGFNYGLGPDIITPDSQKPVTFSLRKKGTPEPLVALKRNYGISRDGTPFAIDLVSGQAAKGENGNLVVQCWTEDQGKQRGQKYEWRCIVTTPGGGLVSTDEEFPFLAPENGYKPTTEINMPADRTNWNSQVDLKFYYRLADGRYGRMTFSMIAGGQHFCMIDSVLNPSGSRILEPAN